MLSAARYLLPVLGDEKFHHRLKQVLMLLFAPLALILALFFCVLSGGASHNCTAVDLCFSGVPPSQGLPLDYRLHLTEMQSAFQTLDAAVSEINSRTADGNRLDPTRVKAIFYALTFENNAPNRVNAKKFADCFVRYVEQKDGPPVPVPVEDLDTVYQNLFALEMDVSEKNRANATAIYNRICADGDGCSGNANRGGTLSDELDVSDFLSPQTKNAHDLAVYAEQAWLGGWGYVWGTYGTVLTDDLLQYKISQYPDGVGHYAPFIRQTWLGGRTTDCVGLIKGYGWLDPDHLTIGYQTHGMPDLSADGMYRVATVKGSIESIPETPGLAVWHSGHIGVYIGNGEVIEAMGTHYGVVKTQLSERNWTAWLQVPHIQYNTMGGTTT